MIGATITFVRAYAEVNVVVGSEYKFYYDTMSISDVTAVLVTKSVNDSYSITDVAVIESQPNFSDSVSFSDSFDRVVTYSKSISDSFTLDDTLQADSIESDKTNIVTISEVLGFALSRPVTDSISNFSDELTHLFDKGSSDTLTFSDDFSATFIWNRSFSDSASISESQSFNHSKALTDGFTLDDAALINKNYSGTKGNVFSFTDSISITRTHGKALGNMVLGTSTLN